jgi:hypothetical protein
MASQKEAFFAPANAFAKPLSSSASLCMSGVKLAFVHGYGSTPNKSDVLR